MAGSTTFPGAVDAFDDIPSGGTQDVAYGGRKHSQRHNDTDAAMEAVQTKLGIISSTPTTNTVLRSNGPGVSVWQQLQPNDIAADAVRTAAILDGVVTTPKLAAAAVTQNGHADGSSSGPTTTSGLFVDMTDMSVTLTTVGGDLLVWFDGSFSQSTSGQGVFVGLRLDSGSDVAGVRHNFQHTSQDVFIGTHHRFTGVAAGSHTVKARWSVSGGQGTATSTERHLTVLEVKR
jgi:hypothetical protein